MHLSCCIVSLNFSITKITKCNVMQWTSIHIVVCFLPVIFFFQKCTYPWPCRYCKYFIIHYAFPFILLDEGPICITVSSLYSELLEIAYCKEGRHRLRNQTVTFKFWPQQIKCVSWATILNSPCSVSPSKCDYSHTYFIWLF